MEDYVSLQAQSDHSYQNYIIQSSNISHASLPDPYFSGYANRDDPMQFLRGRIGEELSII